ncbi:unnamed protein product [Brassica rapa subsp. trilocularis]
MVVHLADESCLTKEYLDTKIDWIPSMRNLRLKDIPPVIQPTNPDDINFMLHETDRAKRASAIILNTFDDLENDRRDSVFGLAQYQISGQCSLC